MHGPVHCSLFRSAEPTLPASSGTHLPTDLDQVSNQAIATLRTSQVHEWLSRWERPRCERVVASCGFGTEHVQRTARRSQGLTIDSGDAFMNVAYLVRMLLAPRRANHTWHPLPAC